MALWAVLFFAFLLFLLFFGFGCRLLSVYALYTSRGPCSFFRFFIYLFIHQKKKKKKFQSMPLESCHCLNLEVLDAAFSC